MKVQFPVQIWASAAHINIASLFKNMSFTVCNPAWNPLDMDLKVCKVLSCFCRSLSWQRLPSSCQMIDNKQGNVMQQSSETQRSNNNTATLAKPNQDFMFTVSLRQVFGSLFLFFFYILYRYKWQLIASPSGRKWAEIFSFMLTVTSRRSSEERRNINDAL